MSKTVKLCGVGLAALALATGPGAAISLNIGGDGGLVSVSPSSPPPSSGGISVDVGGDDGDLLDRRLIDLNGGSKTDALVDVDLGTNGGGLVDLDTNGNTDGVIIDLFGAKGAVADIDVGLGEEEGLLGDKALLSLDGGDGAAIILDLFGPAGTGDAVAELDLKLGERSLLEVNGDGDASVSIDLFGAGDADASSALAAVELGAGDDALVGDPAVLVDLFGSGTGEDVDDTATGSTGSPGAGGSNGTDGTDGTGVSPTAPGTGIVQPAPLRPGSTVRVATAPTGSVDCFSPDQGQIAYLLARKAYSAEVTAQWDGAEQVRLVPINLCEDARARLDAALAADANIGILHSAVAADAKLSAALDPNYQPDDVLAVDQSGEDLTVYVY